MQYRFIIIVLIAVNWLPLVTCYYKCNQQSVPCGCGLKTVETSTEINNGEYAVPYSWTMIVSLRYDCLGNGNALTHCCSGTILSESFILTTAHCVERINEGSILLDNITIVTGRFSQFQQFQTTRRVDQILIHPNWKKIGNRLKHDIAILHLETPLDFDSNLLITRTCLPTNLNFEKNIAKSLLSNSSLIVIGWKFQKVLNNTVQDVLQQTTLSSVPLNDSSCAKAISDIDTQFCAKTYEDCKDICVGEDSSSPIFRWIGDRWEQIGIVSYRREDLTSDNNAIVCTRLDSYYDWIKGIMNLKSNTTSTMSITVSPRTNRPPIIYNCDKTSKLCGCGLNNVALVSNRIVNGEEAVPYSWSMIVSLRFDCLNNGNIHTHCCGGTILNSYYILTAAHCVQNVNLSSIKSRNITIAAGIHNLTEANQTIRYVDQIFIHPGYRGSIDQFKNDIAILHLSEPLDLDTNPRIARTCRSTRLNSIEDIREYPSNGSMLAVVGWGLLNRPLNIKPQLLHQLSVYVIHHIYPTCAQYIGSVDVQFCAGVYESNKGPCNGDSGGPIMLWSGDHWEQVGIASYIIRGCAIPGYPSVYTRLTAYHDWIEWIMNRDNYTTTTTTVAYRPPTIYACNSNSSCGCGSTNVALPSTRIIGGGEAIPYSWSMLVSIQHNCYNNGNFKAHCCGGTIINEHYILTAAHCVEQFNQSSVITQNITVVAGIHNLSDINRTTRYVDKIFIHPEYAGQKQLYKNDIAILHLSEALDLNGNSHITKTCLPPQINSPQDLIDYPSNGSMLVAIGWGAIDRPVNVRPLALQQLSISAIHHNDSTCARSIGHVGVQFCGGLYEGGKGICYGDSGGPVFKWLNDHWEQVGISSYVMNGCASIGYQSVFTRVVSFYDWINKIVNQMNHTTSTVSNTTITSVTPSTSQPINGLMSTYRQKQNIVTFKVLVALITFLRY